MVSEIWKKKLGERKTIEGKDKNHIQLQNKEFRFIL